jgi:signal transduction histidine kinase
VRAHQDAGRLVIEVSDTGIGFDADRPAAEGSGFGLAQVRERLATVYGDQGQMSLAADPAGGTRTIISFPLPPRA